MKTKPKTHINTKVSGEMGGKEKLLYNQLKNFHFNFQFELRFDLLPEKRKGEREEGVEGEREKKIERDEPKIMSNAVFANIFRYILLISLFTSY